MAKKKATMTLKDFHGGSIPSDLPLPSAPGVMVRQPDRISFDRPSSWGNPTARSDHRLRPGSAGAARNFEERGLFFTNTSHIGRNFDEDERKPLDGGSAPRRTVSDENIIDLPVRANNNVDYLAVNPPASHPCSTPTPEYSGRGVSGLYTGKVTEVNNNYGGNSGYVAGGSRPNAWGLRKDSAAKEIVSPTLSASDAASKMAHASALDKVSSGRWHPKQQQQMSRVDVDYVSYTEPEKACEYIGPVMYPKDTYTTDVGKDKSHDSGKMLSAYESSINPHDAYDIQLQIPSQTAERPRLKLLPRSKPLEKMEPSMEFKGYNQHSELAHMKNECVSPPSTKTLQTEFYVSDQGVERPKLNLQSRLQPLERVGGANGREMMVQKGRGVVDAVSVINKTDMGVKQEFVKSHRVTHQFPVNHPVDSRTARSSDKREYRTDLQHKNWRSENRGNYRRNEERQQQQSGSQERAPSPETWRKPVEQPGNSGLGKVASPLELAQAFSKTKSDMANPERLSGHRSFSNRSQVPFSRLTVSSPRPQINGH